MNGHLNSGKREEHPDFIYDHLGCISRIAPLHLPGGQWAVEWREGGSVPLPPGSDKLMESPDAPQSRAGLLRWALLVTSRQDLCAQMALHALVICQNK